jgi:alkylation response protein AidB-like acyl-CoA dehydrogenase
MDFQFSDEQVQLRQALRAFLSKHYSFAQRTAGIASERGWQPGIWKAFAQELGILGVCLPARLGGFEHRALETMVIMEELGNALVVEPFIETIVIAGGLLRLAGGERADRALQKIAAGESIFAVALDEPTLRNNFARTTTVARQSTDGWILNGGKTVVSVAPWADQFIVLARTAGNSGDRNGLSLFLLATDTPGLTVSGYQTIDSRSAAELRLNGAVVPANAQLGELNEALPQVEQVVDEAVAALNAEALGILRRMLQETVSYTKQRRQFGRTLAEFQVLQHGMVDMFMAIENSQSALYLSTLELEQSPLRRATATAAVKVAIGSACRLVGQRAIQTHGGIGMADELALGHYFKRATVIEAEFGTANDHIVRYARLRREEANGVGALK